MKIIGVSGKSKAGKDLLAKYMAEYGWERWAFADELKARIRRDFSLDTRHTDGELKDTKLPYLNGYSPRELMIDYGVVFRMYRPNYWCDQLFDKLRTNLTTTKVIITDVRFPNEAEYIKKRWGMVVRLERHPSRNKLVDQDVLESPSETVMDKFDGFTAVLPADENIIPEDLKLFAEQLNRLTEIPRIESQCEVEGLEYVEE